MIRAIADLPDGRKLLILGIDNGNIKRLKKKMPISVNVTEHLPEIGLQLAIHWGRTLRDLEAEMAPYVDLKTKVHLDPKAEEIMDGEPEPKKFVIEIETANAAFRDCPGLEIGQVLLRIVSQLEKDPTRIDEMIQLRDTNGNTVGTARME